MVEMPNIVGFTRESAEKELTDNHIKASFFLQENNGDYASNCVVYTDVEPGTFIDVNKTIVNVYIAKERVVYDPPAATSPGGITARPGTTLCSGACCLCGPVPGSTRIVTIPSFCRFRVKQNRRSQKKPMETSAKMIPTSDFALITELGGQKALQAAKRPETKRRQFLHMRR